MSNTAPPPVYTFTMSYQTARRAAEFIMREFPPPDDYRPYQIVNETWANLCQDNHSECGPDCPALLPRQWQFRHLTVSQRFAFKSYIDHDGITDDDRQRLDILIPGGINRQRRAKPHGVPFPLPSRG